MQNERHLVEVMFVAEMYCHLRDRYTISRVRIGTKLL